MTKYSICQFLIIVIFAIVEVYPSQYDPLLLYSTTKDIRIANTSRSNNGNKIKTTILIRNLTDGSAIDYHYEQKKLCWTDHGLESIHCAHFNGLEIDNKVETVVNGVLSPVGLACDWFTNKLYWTDSDTNRIEVATMEGEYRKVLYWTDIDQPRAIALVPMKGLMFWTDWGEIPKIERAGMDGDPHTRRIIISENIFWPNGLTVDYDKEIIYWIDGRLKFIEMIDYDGKKRQKILEKSFEYPFALTLYDEKFYWTDWKTWSIHFYDHIQNDTKELLHLTDSVPMDIHVYDKQRQPKWAHPCEQNNGNCSHLCLLSPNHLGYTCACPIGIKLINDTTCAQRPQELLLLARRTDICLIHLDSPDYTHKILPLIDIKYTIAVDYDPIDQFIYWSDDEVKKIQKSYLNGTNQQDVIVNDIQHPDGISIDFYARNIYWTDTGTDRVEVAHLISPHYRTVIISDNLIEPRGIAVASELGWLFWSDWYEKAPKVERANLDGTERLAIVTKNLGWPNGITLDISRMKIYWCDAKLDKIEYANMDGNDRRELINDNVPHVFGFSLMDGFIYWTDWQRRTIDRADKESGGRREIIAEQIPNVMGLKAINLNATYGTNLCAIRNGDCQQLCFYRHDKTRVCACQIGHELSRDHRNCVVPEAFLIYARRDGLARISIENANNEIPIPIAGLKQITSIDYEMNTMRIYWSDTKLRTIMRAYINGSDPQRIIELGLTAPEDIAIDWMGLNVYWTDPQAHRIEVARLVGTSRRTLLWGEVDEPHAIVLDPLNGFMYWSEWGVRHSIRKGWMDGTHTHQLLTTNGKAIDLTFDHDGRRLYWIEHDQTSIWTSDLNGNDKKCLQRHNDDEHLNGLTIFKNYLYFIDTKNDQVMKLDKTEPTNIQRIEHLSDKGLDLMVIHEKPIGMNQCNVGNGGCSHLCLTIPARQPDSPVDYTCACPTHHTLTDGKCLPPKQFMIYAQKNLAVRLLPDTIDCPEAVLPVQGLKSLKAIDFDPVHNFLYWIEGKSQTIKRAEAITSTQTTIVIGSNSNLMPYDIVVDALGRLLFWTCALQDVVNVTRLDNSIPFGIVVQKDGEKPRLLALHTTKRLLFYTDVGKTPQLIRTRLDGSHRLVITRAADIAAIAVDTINDLLVWTQGQSIYISNIDGENQHVLLNESNSRITQLTIHTGWLYWIDRELHQLQRLELISGKSRSTLSVQATHIIDIISVMKSDRNHSCAQIYHQHKRCSHLCIMNGTAPVCACPKGYVLKDDRRTCSTLFNCGADRFTCTLMPADEKDCIPLSWRCDHQEDCSNGSDEMDCPDCRTDQFKCRSDRRCVDLINVCDGIAHCQDRSDEMDCCTDGFRCPDTQVCLPNGVVCDGTDNCADGSDEHRALCTNPGRTLLTAQSRNTSGATLVVLVVVGAFVLFIGVSIVFYCLVTRCSHTHVEVDEASYAFNGPTSTNRLLKAQKFGGRKGIPDVVRMSMLNGCNSSVSNYERSHVTGASSSTNESAGGGYPRNPPPSPATTANSTRASSPSTRYRPYKHYRAINQPPPPTPCSTDVCDESDYNYPTRGPFPPPPTPRSHCQSESCPPSPSSRSSTYFSPLPPPPSPVASSSRRYDS